MSGQFGGYLRVVHMALAMSRPWKHPKTGVYWLRKRVPDALQRLVGKREEEVKPEELKIRYRPSNGICRPLTATFAGKLRL